MKAFEILVYAIITIALILLFYAVWQSFEQTPNNLAAMKKGIEIAQTTTYLGQTVLIGELKLGKGFTLSRTDFDLKNMLLGIECTTPQYCCPKSTATGAAKCTKPIQWDDSGITIQDYQPKNFYTYARCTRIEGTALCKLYFGDTPAQAKIESITAIGKNGSGEDEFRISLTNSGKTTLLLGEVSLELLKKQEGKWETTDYTSSPKDAGELPPGAKTQIYWAIDPLTLGDYKATFTFSSQNAGFDKNSIIFSKSTIASNCQTAQGIQTIYDPTSGGYQEMRNCTGCNYGYECVVAWTKKESKTQFYPYSKDSTYCLKASENGTC